MKWEKVKLSDCCLSITDGDHQPPPKAEKGIPFVTISNITSTNQFDFEHSMHVPVEYYQNLDEKKKAVQGDILYSVVGSYGIPVLMRSTLPFVFQRHIAILKPNREIVEPSFLYYMMLSRDFYMKADAVAIGAAQRTISLNALRNIEIDLPDLRTQIAIAETLNKYDALIDNNQKQIKLLEEAAQRLYKEWFVDLRFPGYENTKIVDGVPEGWKKSHISDICDTVGGGTPSTKVREFYENGDILWVTPSDITKNDSMIVLDTATKITQAGLKNSSAKMLPPETILMTSRASVGYFGLCEQSVCTNQGFISCVPYEKSMQMYLLFNLKNRVDEIRQNAGGSTYFEISKRTFRAFKIVVPEIRILKQFQSITSGYIQMMCALTKSVVRLQQTRDSLLPKLMNRELEVWQ